MCCGLSCCWYTCHCDTKPVDVPTTTNGFDAKRNGASVQVDCVQDRLPVLPTTSVLNADHSIHLCATCFFKLQNATTAFAGNPVFHPVYSNSGNCHLQVCHPVTCVNMANIHATAPIAGIFGLYTLHPQIAFSFNFDCGWAWGQCGRCWCWCRWDCGPTRTNGDFGAVEKFLLKKCI